jgi:hypothetical protein
MVRSQKDKGAKKWKEVFIDAYSRIPIIRVAAGAANVSRQTVYEARRRDMDFADRMASAEIDGAEGLEARAHQMASAGNERLLMFLLEHVLPEKYGRTQKVDMTGDFNAFTIKITDDDDSDQTT